MVGRTASTFVFLAAVLLVAGCGGVGGGPSAGGTQTSSDAPPGVRVTVTYLDDSGEHSSTFEPVVTGPVDITFDVHAHRLEIPTGRPHMEPIEGLPADAQQVEDCDQDPPCGLVLLDLEALPEGVYDVPVETMLGVATARVEVERTPPTEDVDVQGDWTLVSLQHGDRELTVPEGGTYALSVDGIGMGGTIDCNSFGGVLTVDGNAVNSRWGGQTDMGCPDDGPAAAASEFDHAFVLGLDQAERVSRNDDRLVLQGPEVRLTFERR